jgi:hypothetical protein
MNNLIRPSLGKSIIQASSAAFGKLVIYPRQQQEVARLHNESLFDVRAVARRLDITPVKGQ